MKKMIILMKIKVTMKTFSSPFFNRVVMRAIKRKLNMFMLQLPIYYMLKQLSVFL